MPFPLVNKSDVLVDKVQNIIVSVNVMSLYTIKPLVAKQLFTTLGFTSDM